MVAAERSKLGAVQLGIMVLMLATAAIHLYEELHASGIYRPLLTLDGLGYLGLLALYVLPLPLVQEHRRVVPQALIAYIALSIAAFIV